MEIPKEGFCKTRKREIIQFFRRLYPDCKEKLQVEHIGIAWDKGSFWFIKGNSFKPLISEELLLNIIQLKVGKWYKINNNDIAKFHHLKEDKFYAVDWISNGKFTSFEEPVWNSFDYLISISIEEVRQYLPDGHPDKLSKLLTIDNLVGGEAYFAKFDKEEWNSLFYCKAPPTFTVRLYVSDKYTGKRYNPRDWKFNKGINYRLATTEEKQWLNVCISEGKFIEKDYALKDYNMYGKPLKSEEIKEEFKVGDWVYADRQSNRDFRYDFGDSYIPIFKVEEIYKSINKSEWLRPVKDSASGVESKYCRLATPEEIAKVNKPEIKQFDRNWYVKVDSQEEADKIFDWLESQGENTFRGHAYFSETSKYIRPWNNTKSKYHNKWFLSSEKHNKPQKQLSDILPEYKQSIKTEEELSHIIDTNEELRYKIGDLINQRDFKSSDFAQPIIIKSKKQKRNKLLIIKN